MAKAPLVKEVHRFNRLADIHGEEVTTRERQTIRPTLVNGIWEDILERAKTVIASELVQISCV